MLYKLRESKNIEQKLAESFEKTIRNLQKEGLFENIKSFDLDFTGKGINIKLNESSESSKTSTTPFMDEIFSLAQKIYIFDEIIDKWPDSYDYYSEVAESVGDDYDDIKDMFDFDQLGLSDCIEFITEHDGENIAKKMFGTIENIQKSFEEYDSNEDVKNALTQFVDYFRDDLNEYEEQYWRECIDSDVSDWNAYYSDDDDDNDY